MKTVVIYNSQTGFTKRYAEWIADATNADCLALLLIGIAVFTLEVFVLQKPDGVLGFLICLVSVLLTFGSIIKLCRLSPRFEDGFLKTLDILFWLP